MEAELRVYVLLCVLSESAWSEGNEHLHLTFDTSLSRPVLPFATQTSRSWRALDGCGKHGAACANAGVLLLRGRA